MTLRPVVHALALVLMWHRPFVERIEPLPAWWNGGRVFTSTTLHIGVRPAFDLGNGVGFTVQFTVRTPW